MWTKGAICIWIDGINVHDSSMSTVLPPSPIAPQPQKRKRELSEMSNNVQTPRKAARMGKDTVSVPHGTFEDNNATPRPLHPLSNLVHFSSPRAATSIAATGTSEPDDDAYCSPAPSSQSSTNTTGSRGVKRKRSASPTKQMDERRYAKYPIQHRPVTNPEAVNMQIRDVVKRVKRIGRAKGILSARYAGLAQTLSGGEDDLAQDILDNGEDRYGSAPDLTRMQRIVERTVHNSAGGAWNSGVHDFLLEEVYIGSSVSKHLIWENM